MASYHVKLEYSDHDHAAYLEAETVGVAVIMAAGGKPKPDRVSVKVLVKRPGADQWVGCYVSNGILQLLG